MLQLQGDAAGLLPRLAMEFSFHHIMLPAPAACSCHTSHFSYSSLLNHEPGLGFRIGLGLEVRY